jgi:hypothetical protein
METRLLQHIIRTQNDYRPISILLEKVGMRKMGEDRKSHLFLDFYPFCPLQLSLNLNKLTYKPLKEVVLI